jgi:transposase-like protein
LELDSKTKARKDISKEKKYTVSEFIVDETIFKVGDEFVFLWVAIEPLDKVILGGIRISLLKEACLLQSIFYVL